MAITGYGPGPVNPGTIVVFLLLYWFLLVAGITPLIYILAWAAGRGWRDGKR